MKPPPPRHRHRTPAAITIAAVLALTGCTTPQITSPIGEWVAVEDDHGVLTIRPDGTFTMTEVSFNPLQYRDADDDFNAAGTWRLIRDDTEIALDFEEASQGKWNVDPSGRAVPFSSGTIRFHDPDDVLDIKFRLVNETSE